MLLLFFLPLIMAHDNTERHDDYSRSDVMLSGGVLLLVLLCVFGVWIAMPVNTAPHVIRHTIVLPSRHGKPREYELESC